MFNIYIIIEKENVYFKTSFKNVITDNIARNWDC